MIASLPRRISDARAAGVPAVYPEYATVDPVNCNGTRMVLCHGSDFWLYSGDGSLIRRLPIGASSCPRWHPDSPADLWYVDDARPILYVLDTDSGKARITDNFDSFDYATISIGCGEGRAIGYKLAIVGDGRKALIYDGKSGSATEIKAEANPIESVYLTGSGAALVAWRTPVRAPMQLFNKEGTLVRLARQLPPNGHMDITGDTLVWCSSDDPSQEGCPNGAVRIDLKTGDRTCLLPLDWNLAYHITCSGESAIVSTYGNSQSKYAGKILHIPLAGGEPEILCAHGSSARDYTAQPKALVTGKRVLFASDVEGLVDTYMIDLGHSEPVERPDPDPVPRETTKDDVMHDLGELVAKHGGGSG